LLLRKEPRSGEYSLGAEGYHLVRMQGRVWPLPSPTRFYGFPDEVSARFQNAAFTNDLVLSLEQQLKRILHLGPLREIPNRTYAWAGDAPEHVGPKGAAAVAALLAGSNRKIGLGNSRGRHFQEVVARWL